MQAIYILLLMLLGLSSAQAETLKIERYDFDDGQTIYLQHGSKSQVILESFPEDIEKVQLHLLNKSKYIQANLVGTTIKEPLDGNLEFIVSMPIMELQERRSRNVPLVLQAFRKENGVSKLIQKYKIYFRAKSEI